MSVSQWAGVHVQHPRVSSKRGRSGCFGPAAASGVDPCQPASGSTYPRYPSPLLHLCCPHCTPGLHDHGALGSHCVHCGLREGEHGMRCCLSCHNPPTCRGPGRLRKGRPSQRHAQPLPGNGPQLPPGAGVAGHPPPPLQVLPLLANHPARQLPQGTSCVRVQQ